MNTTLNRLIANVRSDLPGALDNAIKMSLFNVVDEACRDGNLWQDDQTVKGKENKVEYSLSVPSGAIPLRLMKVIDNDRPVAATIFHEYLLFQTQPEIDKVYTVTLALAPDPETDITDTPGVPDAFWAQYYHFLEAGVLSRMMAQQAKPYTNVQMAAVHYKRFKSGVNRARMDMNTAHTFGAQNWRFPQSFNRTRGNQW
jgi:hypothetical protein